MQQLETVGPRLGITLVGVAGGEIEAGSAPCHGHQVDSVVLGPRHCRQVNDGLEVVGLHRGGKFACVLYQFLVNGNMEINFLFLSLIELLLPITQIR